MELQSVLPPEILTRAASFPISPMAMHENVGLQTLYYYLPQAEIALELRTIFYTHAAWMYVASHLFCRVLPWRQLIFLQVQSHQRGVVRYRGLYSVLHTECRDIRGTPHWAQACAHVHGSLHRVLDEHIFTSLQS